jgi:DNA-binding GntR family transcriptional regulator
LRPGAKLPLHELVLRYQVSLIPLREALFQLAADGLVVQDVQRGFRVAPISTEDLADIVSVRRSVEPMAFGLSVERGDSYWRSNLATALDRFSRVRQMVGDTRPITDDWEASHRAFHFALISSCGSPMLLRICAQIHDRFDRYRRIAIPLRAWMAGTAEDHDDLFRAASVGDRAQAVELLALHVDHIATVLTAHFATGGAIYDSDAHSHAGHRCMF